MAKASKSTKLKKPPKDRGNFISEWFGHRLYPVVTSDAKAFADQESQICPFLSAAKAAPTECVKKGASRGVCTISSVSNLVRQDWLACPYRALSPELLEAATRRLYQVVASETVWVMPAIRLSDVNAQSDVVHRLAKGEKVFIYFDNKLGGELSIPATSKSPEFSFDVTIFEIVSQSGVPHIGRFAVLEIQTADFHGSYERAVKNLTGALHLHRDSFAAMIQANQHWLSEKVEGPNIANVFKRTFYQMMFKFQLARDGLSAGCALAISTSVWDSWQKHLAAPALTKEPDGSFNLFKPGGKRPEHIPAWILVFEADQSSTVTPRPIVFSKVIATDAPSFSYFALEEAPVAALTKIATSDGMFGLMLRRLEDLWPSLAKTLKLSAPTAKEH